MDWEEEIKTLLAADILPYVRSLKELAKKFLELRSNFGQVAGHRVNTQNSIAYCQQRISGIQNEKQYHLV